MFGQWASPVDLSFAFHDRPGSIIEMRTPEILYDFMDWLYMLTAPIAICDF